MSDQMNITWASQMITQSAQVGQSLIAVINDLLRCQLNAKNLHEITVNQQGQYACANDLSDEMTFAIAHRCNQLNKHYFLTDNGNETRGIFIQGSAAEVQKIIDDVVLAQKNNVLETESSILSKSYPKAISINNISEEQYNAFLDISKINNLHFAAKFDNENGSYSLIMNPSDKDKIIKTLEETKHLTTGLFKEHMKTCSINSNAKNKAIKDFINDKESFVIAYPGNPGNHYKCIIDENDNIKVEKYSNNQFVKLSKQDRKLIEDIGCEDFIKYKSLSLIDGGVIDLQEFNKMSKEQRVMAISDQNPTNLLDQNKEFNLNKEAIMMSQLRYKMEKEGVSDFTIKDCFSSKIAIEFLGKNYETGELMTLDEFAKKYPKTLEEIRNFSDKTFETIDVDPLRDISPDEFLRLTQMTFIDYIAQSIPGHEERMNKAQANIDDNIFGK